MEKRLKPLKVALVGPHALDTGTIANGVEAVVTYLAQGLGSMPEIDLSIISTRYEARRHERIDSSGCVVYSLPATRRFGNLSLGIFEKRRIKDVLATINPDIVHVHNHANYPFLGWQLPFPAVTTVHGFVFKESAFERERFDWIRRVPRLLLETIAFKRIKEVIAVSSYVRSVVEEKSDANVRIVYNPVSMSFFETANREVAGRILFVGAINRRKNVLGLLQAFALLRAQTPHAELRLAGAFTEPSYANEIEAFVREKQLLDAVRFLGQLSDTGLVTEYEACQVVASASHEETAGMIFQQAMAAGKPSVGTRVGGVADIIADGCTGLLVAPSDIEGLAAALAALLSNADLRSRMRVAGQQQAFLRFHPQAIARQTYDVYREILSTPR